MSTNWYIRGLVRRSCEGILTVGHDGRGIAVRRHRHDARGRDYGPGRSDPRASGDLPQSTCVPGTGLGAFDISFVDPKS